MARIKLAGSLSSISRNRLEFLFDGIFAISMTILVLELKVPELSDRHSISELSQALLHHGATFISYIISFVMLGILWYKHNYYYRYLAYVTRRIFILTLAQLAAAAFFPFCAALLGKYPTNRVTMVVYIGCIMIYSWCCLLQWLYAKKESVLVPRLNPITYKEIRKGNIIASIGTTAMFLLYLSTALIN